MNVYPPPPAWADDITSIGVTGTNGKTSTTRFISAGLAAAAGGPVARVTTVDAGIINNGDGLDDELGPPPLDHQAFLQLMQTLHDRGGRRAAIEATSATLGLGFARAWPVRVGVFTNLGHDHLRTHGSFEHYLASKAQLFVGLPPGGAAVLNASDPNSELIAEILPPHVRALYFAGPGPCPAAPKIQLRVVRATPTWAGLELELEAAPELGPVPKTLRLCVIPRFQADNAAAALLACLALGVPGPAAAEAIARVTTPPGRFEPVEPHTPTDPRVVIDYAHTPEALRAALDSARSLCIGRVILVVGAGGDTDANKREPLGAAASLADIVWITNDNPRHEDPAIIAQAIREGIVDTEHHIELDRRRAITTAIQTATHNDLVLIAGKGHERFQEIAGQHLPSSDLELAREALSTG